MADGERRDADEAIDLSRAPQPDAFERWRVILQPMTEGPTDPAEWDAAIVLVEAGAIDAICAGGGWRTFVEGDLLALAWLPVVALRNPGARPASLLAVRRRDRAAGGRAFAGPEAPARVGWRRS